MKIYSAYGINDLIVCCGYKGYVIKEFFANYFLHMSDVTFNMEINSVEVHNRKAEPWKVTLVDTGENTQQEAFGHTVIEAMSCGVPVIGFNVGGINDSIRHNKTGILVEKGGEVELSNAMGKLIEDEDLNHDMSLASREVAVNEFDVSVVAKQYLDLYESILN